MTVTAPRDNISSGARPAPAHGPEVPFCLDCRSDEFLIFEDFVPARIQPNGLQNQANASYSCSNCGQFSGHQVPPSWTPPGWDWYA
jgi:hypothetical protein